jgi:hypothetical protein
MSLRSGIGHPNPAPPDRDDRAGSQIAGMTVQNLSHELNPELRRDIGEADEPAVPLMRNFTNR